MPNTYSQIYIHVVFAVKGRESLISPLWKNELYKYICGIVNNKEQKVYAINGMSDHIHILLSIKPDVALSSLIRDVNEKIQYFFLTKNICLNGRINMPLLRS